MEKGSIINVLDICTGIGGFSLALKWLVGGFRTVCYVEWDKYCQQVIQQRIRDGYLDDAPIWSDLREFNGKPWRGTVDLITAGFPCQPFSVAGKQKGADDERNLWPDVARVIREVRPPNVFLENVPALLNDQYCGRIFGSLVECGYNIRWCSIPASDVGAPHRRERVWIVAYPKRHEHLKYMGKCRIQDKRTNENGQVWRGDTKVWGENWIKFILDVGGVAPAKWEQEGQPFNPRPLLVRDNNGLSDGLDRLKTLGNSVVPAVVAKAWSELTR